jgi:23S rRNA (uracil1939-C5)-methyltransferase
VPVSPAPRPALGTELELSIDSLAHGGAGVARHDGYVVFVPGTVPGDRVRARLVKRKRSYGEARLQQLLDPGPERVPERADHPGVPWQVLPYERQLAVKEDQVRDALQRIGGLSGDVVEPIVPAREQWRYRNKLEYSFGADEGGRLVCGFHEPGRWDRVVAVDDCLLASHAGNAARELALSWARDTGLSAHDRRTGEGILRNLVVREGRRTGALQLRLVTAPARLELDELARELGDASLLWTCTEARAEVTSGGATELISGPARLPERLLELELEISPEAFFQTNTEMAETLYEIARELTALEGWERAFDLYCGIGTVGLSLAPRLGELWGLELVPDAVRDARRNAERNEISNARFEVADVRLALRELTERAGRPDVVVVDPPRAGLSAKVVRRIVECSARRIVYVSCNPTTLAPNAAQLVEAGWSLRRVRPVDMFPQTPHIECVALLERGPSA